MRCKKKVSHFPVHSRDVTYQTLPGNSPWPGIIKLFPARESLVSDIPAGDGKMANLFLQCMVATRLQSKKYLCQEFENTVWNGTKSFVSVVAL
jgi:hypothetical protein